MNKPVPTCHYCNVAMEPGMEFHRSSPKWVEGEPEFDRAEMPKLSGKRMYWIDGYRCPKCGLIEKRASERLPGATSWPIETVKDE